MIFTLASILTAINLYKLLEDLLNNQSSGFFNNTRGLRGMPSSTTLEVLIPTPFKKDSSFVYHLLFADDVMMTLSSVLVAIDLRKLLEEFEKFLRCGINR